MSFEKLLICHGSPTLAGLKTGALFWYSGDNPKQHAAIIQQWNQAYQPKGLVLEAVKTSPQGTLCYLYRPGKLSLDLSCKDAREILKQQGYPVQDISQILLHLKKRLSASCDFPHEIGLFLGYPPEDVLGFMENRGKNYQCCGCWKVYCNLPEKQKLFARYKKCSAVYDRLFEQGRSLWQLTVPSFPRRDLSCALYQ